MAERSRWWANIVGTFASIPARIAGEISVLRAKSLTLNRRWNSRYGKVYKLDSSRVDYKLARSLYDNTADDYKLGAWAPKPIINTVVGFMGVPTFRSTDPDAQEALDEFFEANRSLQQQTHRNALRDGDCWVWITRERAEDQLLYPEHTGYRLVYNIIPPEMVSEIIRDPFTGKEIEYVLKSIHEWTDDNGYSRKGTVTQRISADRRLVTVEGDIPPGVEVGEFPNRWGFIPIVQFSNEKDAASANGRSEIEPIEPFIKAYHDVLMQAIQGNKLHSTPKLKMKLSNVSAFLRNNFGVEDPAKFLREGGEISLDDQELIFLESNDEAGFLEVKSATGTAEPLLKLLFMCIVDVSETPEFAFGVHTPSSQASVTEQMPVLIRKVSRKRENFTEAWQQVARIVLAMTSISSGRRFSTHATTLEWDDVDPRDSKDEAQELEIVVRSLAQAVQNNLMGLESAVNYLARYVPTMAEYEPEETDGPSEREKIIQTKLIMARLDDAELVDKELEEIEEMLRRLGADVSR